MTESFEEYENRIRAIERIPHFGFSIVEATRALIKLSARG